MRPKFALLSATVLVVAGLVPSLLSAQSSGASAPSKSISVLAGLRVLIANDDSVQPTRGTGLYELRKALCAAGADVIAVGPWGPQSGVSGRITTSGPVTVQAVAPPAAYEHDCNDAPSGGGVFGACASAGPCEASTPSASPADAVGLAITRFLPDNYWPEGPSVVVSGINPGQNTGLGAAHSGTVGATIMAHDFDVPAIAFSEQVIMDCVTSGTDCPAFADTAEFATRLLAALRNEGALEPGLLLNVNYPNVRSDEEVSGPVLNFLGRYRWYPEFAGPVGADGGTYTLTTVDSPGSTEPGADQTANENNQISVVPMSGNWSFAPVVTPQLRRAIRSLR